MTIPPPPGDRERPVPFAQERWKAVFDNPRIGVTVTGPDGRFLETNERFQSLVGYVGEELRHMTVLEITHPDDLATHLRAADAIRSGNSQSVHFDKRYLRKGGGVVWVQVTALRVPEREGVSGNAIALVEDVTERRAVLERLENQDRLFREAQRIAQFGTWEWDPVADVGVWSDELVRIAGLDAGFRPNLENSLDHVVPEAREAVRRAIESAIAERKNIEYDTEIQRPDGSRRILRVSGAVVFDEKGAVARMVGVSQDITERRRAQLDALEKERWLALAFDQMPAVVWTTDRELRVTSAHGAVRQVVTKDPKDVVGNPVVDYLSGSDGPGFAAHLRALAGEPAEHETIRNGRAYQVHVNPLHDEAGKVVGVIGIALDITERKAVKERLEKQDRLFRDAQRIAHFGTWEWDPMADSSVWSDELHRIFQTDATTFRPNYRAFMEFVAPEDREAVRSTIEAALASGSNVEYDTRIVTPDDRHITIRTFGSPVFDETGVMTRVVGVTQDITAQHRAEERLRESDARYRLLFESNPSPMWVYDVETFRFLAVNEAAVRHYGYSREEFLTMKATEIRPPEEVARWLEHFRTRPDLYMGGTWRHRKKDGTEILVESMARDLDFAGRPARLALVRDVTDRRRGEERLARSAQEMRALSVRLQTVREEEDARVAREVHDEIGQALTALGLDVAWLARNLNRKEGRAKFAAKLLAMAELIETTTGAVERIASDLRPGILDELGLEAAAEWAVREFGERTGVECRFESQLQRSPTDLALGTAIFRILQEALTNVARHARARRVEVRLWEDAAGLHLEVRDDGAGIDIGRIADSRSFGLLGMRERARAFDGNCVITPRTDGGTLVSATLPSGPVRDGSRDRNGGKSDAPHSRRR